MKNRTEWAQRPVAITHDPTASGSRFARIGVGAWSILLVAAIQACTVGPDYVPQKPPAADSLLAAPMEPVLADRNAAQGEAQSFQPGADIPDAWWALFGSPALNSLIAQSLKNNPSLEAAQAALRMANENVKAQSASYYPVLAAAANASRTKSAADLSPPLASPALLYNLYQSQLSMSWSLDMWGRNRRQVEAQQALADAQRFQLEQTYVALSSNVVSAAIQEALLRDQLQDTQSILDDAREILSISERQKEVGQVAGVDLEAQKALVAQWEASVAPLQKQLAQQRDLLTALAGRLPAEAVIETFRLDDLVLPRALPVSLPSRLVEQRADIRFAEANMRAANAEVGVAVADMLPDIAISAQAGSVATKIGQLFSSGTGFWSLGAGVTQPLFDGGALLHRSRAARANYEQVAAQYRSVVITAFQNVADTLHAIQSDGEALAAATAAEQAAQKSFDIARQQLRLGQIGRSGMLISQQTLLQARLALSQARAVRLMDTAALYQALGGGWWNRAGNIDVTSRTP